MAAAAALAPSATTTATSTSGRAPIVAARRNSQRYENSVVCSALRSEAKGFGVPLMPRKKKQQQQDMIDEEDEDEFRPRREVGDDTIPEIVSNRMLKRMGVTVGLPVALGLLAFPLFYYMKMILKMNVPEWAPLMTSMSTFGLGGVGILYAVLSSSWDPLREGSFWGWNEAQVNWALFWEKKE